VTTRPSSRRSWTARRGWLDDPEWEPAWRQRKRRPAACFSCIATATETTDLLHAGLVPCGLREPAALRNGGSSRVRGLPGHAEAVNVAQTVAQRRPSQRSPTRALVPLQPQVSCQYTPGQCHTDRQPGVADLVYLLLIAVAANAGATVRAGRLGAGVCVVGRWRPIRPSRPAPSVTSARCGPLTLPKAAGPRSIASRVCGSRHGPGGKHRGHLWHGTEGGPGSGKEERPRPGSHGSLTLRPSPLAILTVCLGFTWL
jgi:hypothetical protein